MSTLVRQHIQQLKALVFLASLILVTACAGLAKPETFDQRLAYAYGSLAAVRQTAADLVVATRITPQDGQKVLEETDAVRVVLDASRSAYAGKDLSTAEAKLVAAQSLLTTIQRWLQARGGK